MFLSINYKKRLICRGQDVDMLLDAKKENIVLGSAGLETATLPSTAAPFMTIPTGGLLEYTPETQTITGTFDQVRDTGTDFE